MIGSCAIRTKCAFAIAEFAAVSAIGRKFAIFANSLSSFSSFSDRRESHFAHSIRYRAGWRIESRRRRQPVKWGTQHGEKDYKMVAPTWVTTPPIGKVVEKLTDSHFHRFYQIQRITGKTVAHQQRIFIIY